MGWTGTHKESGESVKEFFEKEFNWKDGQVLDCAVVNLREAYLAYKNHNTGQIIAFVCLLNYYPNDYYNFHYKDMSENMGPYVYNCPARILDQLSEPAPNEWAREWREKCRARLERKTNKAKTGNIIKFPTPLEFTNGDKIDTFQVTKVGKKTLFRAVFRDNNGNSIPGTMNYKIPGWTTRDYEVIS